MWETIAALFLAALVWLTVQFFGMPCVRFFRLRTEARETMDLTANVSNRDIDPARYENASEALRKVGIRIGALYETSLPPVPWVLKRLGYDLPGAKGALIGLSNSLSDKTGGRAQCRIDAEVALQLSLSYASRPGARD